MKHIMVAVMLCAGAWSAGLGAQEKGQEKGKMPQYKPQKEHEWLRQFEGDWDIKGKFTPPGQKETKEGTGTESSRVTLGDFWLMIEHKGQHEEMSYEGRGVIGYDPSKKKYCGSWIDNVSPYLMSLEGTADSSGKKFTFFCRGTDPRSGKEMEERMEFQFTDRDHRISRFYKKDDAGKESLCAEMHYTRKAAEAK